MDLDYDNPDDVRLRKMELERKKTLLEEKLKGKLDELKAICIEEYDLTGRVPDEYKMIPGSPLLKFRRKFGASFRFSPKLLADDSDPEMDDLEKQVEINRSVVAANEKVYKESKGILRRRHKLQYKTSASELKKLEERLINLKIEKGKKPIRVSNSIEDCSDEHSLDELDNSRDSSPVKREAVIKSSSMVEYIEMTPSSKTSHHSRFSPSFKNIAQLRSPDFKSPPSPSFRRSYQSFRQSSIRNKNYSSISQRYSDKPGELTESPDQVAHFRRSQYSSLRLNDRDRSFSDPRKSRNCFEIAKPFLSPDAIKYSESKRRQMTLLSSDNVHRSRANSQPERQTFRFIRSPPHFNNNFSDLDETNQTDLFSPVRNNWFYYGNRHMHDSTLV
ncbi:DgyrCDS12123 [Dimorphilus gyrociliatus]|uniref:DgyrCDS12123 n=1 Tax=Dimorphilus gyrociliatus TaxID=2664684 RepID=A0A7I8W6S2_9ANNE|nr:DgyrCDS12123 [Dimorphilus gyrociliatus]